MSLPGKPPYLDSAMIEVIEVCQRHFIALMKELEPLCETNIHLKTVNYGPELTMMDWEGKEREVLFLVKPGEAGPFDYAEIEMAQPYTFRRFVQENPF